MSGDVINLRLARKRRERSEREAEASSARLLHGRTKGERQRQRLTGEKAVRDLEGHRRGDATDPDGTPATWAPPE